MTESAYSFEHFDGLVKHYRDALTDGTFNLTRLYHAIQLEDRNEAQFHCCAILALLRGGRLPISRCASIVTEMLRQAPDNATRDWLLQTLDRLMAEGESLLAQFFPEAKDAH